MSRPSSGAPEPPTSEGDDRNCHLALLIHRAGQGDVEAFEALYDATARSLCGQIRRLVGDAHAEDVLAEVYIQVWNGLHAFDASRAPAGVWLSVIARSRALDHLRREKRLAALLDAGGLLAAGEDTSPDGPELLFSRLEQARLLQAHLAAGLGEDERLAISLAYFRDCSHAEIARITNWPLGTVKSVLARAQQKLRRLLGSQEAPPPNEAKTVRPMGATP